MSKITREETRRDLHEDAIAERGKELAEYFWDHRNTILTIIAVGAALWLAASFVRNYRAGVIDQASFQLFQARSDFARALGETDAAQKKQAFDSSEDRLSKVAEQFASQPIGRRALFQSGVHKFRRLDFAGARAQFEKYRAAARDDLDRARGELAAGACLENEAFISNDDSLRDKALDAYQKAASQAGDSYVKYQAMVNQARILGRLPARRAEAIALLEQVMKERPAENLGAIRDESAVPDPALEDEIKQIEGRSLADEAKDQLERLKAMPEAAGAK